MENRAAQVVLVFLTVFLLGQSLVAQAPSSISRWRASRIVLAVSGSVDNNPTIQGDLRVALEKSVSIWNAAADLHIELRDSDATNVSEKGIRGDGISLLTAAPTAENLRLFPKLSGSPAAVTRVFADSQGRITEADIALNPFVKFSTDGSYGTFDLQDTLTHEVGHLLGLRHSSVRSSIMYDSAAMSFGPGTYAGPVNALQASDVAGIRTLYGSPIDEMGCCGTVFGRIGGLPAHTGDLQTTVWVEALGTGRLAASTVVDRFGNYSIGGIKEGKYRLFVYSTVGNRIATGEDRIAVSLDDVVRKDLYIKYSELNFKVELIGSSPQLSRSGLVVPGDRPLWIFAGGYGDPTEISQVYLSGESRAVSDAKPDLVSSASDPVKMIAFGLPAGERGGPGQYTIVIEHKNGAKEFLIGALSVSDGKRTDFPSVRE